MEVANTLAYYYTATITAVKGFIVQALGWKYFLKKNNLLENIIHVGTLG